MGSTTKVFRVLRTQNVDGVQRNFGDYVPEAADWPNLATYLRSGFVEETFVDSEILEAEIAEQRANDPVLIMEPVEDEEVVDEELSSDNRTPVVGQELPVETPLDIETVLSDEEAGEDVGAQTRTLPAGEPVVHDPSPRKRIKVRKEASE